MHGQTLQALLVGNSHSPYHRIGMQRVRMYLDHFGVPYRTLDLAARGLPVDLSHASLIILGHPESGIHTSSHLGRLRDAVAAGSGVVSFDPELSRRLLSVRGVDPPSTQVEGIEIAHHAHFVTARHRGGETITLASPLSLCRLPGEPLAGADKGALLAAAAIGKGRLLSWATDDWMDTHVLGPLSGLDDLFWRGLAWAARKPFCLRGLPPLVTMRVDDVAGRGGLWDRTALYWMDDAVQAGFRPWLGLFLCNLSAEAVHQTREAIQNGVATAFPHAFGRPPRNADTASFSYYPNAIGLRSDRYDEFIYFDHQHGVSWSDAEAQRGLRAVDAWMADHRPLPISRVALPHWYEMGANTVRHVRQAWQCDMLGKVMAIDRPLAPSEPWLRAGPFRLVEPPGECFPHTPGSRGARPVYYADFVEMGGETFFNSLTEIRDDVAYEWKPDNDVAGAIERGVRQLRRALDAMALASLFTHETDYIYKIRPENWRLIVEGVARGIAPYAASAVTLDEGMAILRATRTSTLRDAVYDAGAHTVTVRFEGEADRATGLYLFASHDAEGQLHRVPPFVGQTVLTIAC